MSTLSVREYGPSPLRDANQLHSACNCGRNGDAGQIISILAHRSAAQRFQIRQAYANFFDEDIIQLFEDVLSGAFKEAVLLWVLGPAERDAQLAYDSMMFGGPALIEIACTRSSDEIFEVRKAYHALFKNSLEEHVPVCVERDFRKLLVPLLTAYRCEDAEVEYTVVEEEARLLHEKIGSHSYANEEIIRILTTRSKAQLKATFNAYHKEFGHPINKDLKSDQDDEFLSMLRAITKCITCPEKYFEKTIRLVINMMESDRETSDRKTITRVIATRAKIDLKLIKELYFKRNGVPLVHAINKYTTGDYEDFLVAIVGEENA